MQEKIILIIIGVIIGFCFGYSSPSSTIETKIEKEIVVKEIIKIQEKIVEKNINTSKIQKKITETKKDGTIVITETDADLNIQTEKIQDLNLNINKELKSNTKIEQIITEIKQKRFIVGINYPILDIMFNKAFDYHKIDIMLGIKPIQKLPFYVFVQGNLNKEVKLGLGVEF